MRHKCSGVAILQIAALAAARLWEGGVEGTKTLFEQLRPKWIHGQEVVEVNADNPHWMNKVI
jgi:hypothetical protein